MTDNPVEEKSSRRRRRETVQEPITAPDGEETGGYTAGKGRATPGRRTQEDPKEEGNVVTRSAGGIREYFSDVRSELEKVSWPTREEAIRLTRVVLIVLVISAIVMGFVNFLFTQFVAFGLQNPLVFVVLLALCVGAALWWFRTHDAPRKSF